MSHYPLPLECLPSLHNGDGDRQFLEFARRRVKGAHDVVCRVEVEQTAFRRLYSARDGADAPAHPLKLLCRRLWSCGSILHVS